MGGDGEGELHSSPHYSAHVRQEDSVFRILFGQSVSQSVTWAMMRFCPLTHHFFLFFASSLSRKPRPVCLSASLSLPLPFPDMALIPATNTNLAFLQFSLHTCCGRIVGADMWSVPFRRRHSKNRRIFGSGKFAIWGREGANFHRSESDEHEIQNSCTVRLSKKMGAAECFEFDPPPSVLSLSFFSFKIQSSVTCPT